VLLLLNNGKEDLMDPSVKNTFEIGSKVNGKVWPEACIDQDPDVQKMIGKQAAPITVDAFDHMPTPRVIKTHATPPFLLGTNKTGLPGLVDGVKVIVITRNPFDACLSSYFYAINPFRNGWPFDAWATVWLSGMAPQADWFDWVRMWAKQKSEHPDRVLWVHYEDLKDDPKKEITRIAEYIDLFDTQTTDSTVITEQSALIDRVVEYSSFDCMKSQSDRAHLASPDTTFKDVHLRKGQSGDWRHYMEEGGEVYASFVEKFHRVLDGTGLVYKLGVGGLGSEIQGGEQLRATSGTEK
jgi:hypothetical protein